MTDDDAKVSARYRELAREEPPRHVDDAILAAARRATASRPAPLVAPSGRRRWYVPVAAAAIIVLAVAVTVHVERQQPDFEVAEQQAAPVQTPVTEPAPKRDSSAPTELQKSQTSSSQPAAPAPKSGEPLAGLRESQRSDTAPSAAQARPEARAMRSERAAEQKVIGLVAASPEQWLQGIADLKRQGRNEEAENQLAEFRKRYPDYRIPESILEKFEKR
jgi:FtsZ-interacting cell division protein ZipA